MTLPTSFVLLSTLISLAAPAPAAVPATAAVPWLLGAVGGALAVGLWALGQRRRHSEALAAQDRALRAVQDAQAKGALGHSQALKASKAQLKAAEIALAAQKKKNFDQHLQLQEALAQGRAAQERADEAIAEAQRARREAEAALLDAGAQGRKARPSKAGQAPKATQAEAVAQPEAEAAPKDGAAPAAAEPTAEARAAQQQQEALSQTLAAAQEAVAEISAQKQALGEELKEARRREARKDKRIEDLRRVDLMSRGKIEVLEDKLKRLGRELYEAISALAVAKGQVSPVPSPRAKARPGQHPKEQGGNILANGHAEATAPQEAKLS